jgi:two-component system response regulator HydG
MKSPGRVLVVDDVPAMCEMIATGLTPRGFEVDAHTDPAQALDAFAHGDFDVVVTDLNMQAMHGIELCQRIVATRPEVPVIVITAFGSLETAAAAIRAGAYDFITKPVEMKALVIALERAIERRRLRDEVERLRRAVRAPGGYGHLLGDSRAMQPVFSLLDRIADSEASVLIVGESGTGKELVARALHARSPRRERPFVALNCAAIPEALIESELFGHVRGAFTDAREDRTGLLAQAEGGMLFLDEVSEMPLAMQPKLLRALQERQVRPIGGTREIEFDVRLVCATNQDLEHAVEEGHFREDLFYRINVIQVPLLPLRVRGGDVLLLAQHFLERFAARERKAVVGLSPEAAERLVAYEWPGNVRELQNCIERAVAVTRFETIRIDDLPERIRAWHPTSVVLSGADPSELVRLEEVERRYNLHVVRAVGGNKTLAAQVLGVARRTLYRKLEHYDLGVDPDAEAIP